MNGEINDHEHKPHELEKYVGKKLCALRLEKNYSLKAVAQDTGISKSTISEIENGLWHNIDKITKLAHYYGLKFENLLPPPS